MTFKPDLTELDTLLITVALSPESLEKVKRKFETVHYYPADPEDVPADVLAKVQVWYSNYAGFPARVTKAEQVPELKVMQLSSGECDSIDGPRDDGPKVVHARNLRDKLIVSWIKQRAAEPVVQGSSNYQTARPLRSFR